MRLFIAFEIPKESLADLERYAERTRSLYLGGRSVPSENLHVTIHFAGECDHRQTQTLRLAMVAAFNESRSDQPSIFPLMLTVAQPGFFRMGNGCVLWLSVTPADPIVRFHAHLMKALSHFGFSEGRQRTPVPHITIARNLPVTVCRKVESDRAMLPYEMPQSVQFFVAGPALMESCQGKGGILYRARCRPAVDEGWIVTPDP